MRPREYYKNVMLPRALTYNIELGHATETGHEKVSGSA
jgi:hypothetical protein